jgi:hypothetical protein
MKRGFPPPPEDILVERVKKLKGSRLGIAFPHVCEAKFCNPECEPGGGYVYVCDFGAVHVCLPDQCTLAALTEYGEWVCPLSGMVHGVDDEEPAMRRNADGKLVPAGWKMVKEKPLVTIPKVTIGQRARHILETLFFGRARSALNQEHAKRQRDSQTQQTQRYLQEQRRYSRFISLPELHRIDANTVLLRPPYKILEQNTQNTQHVERCVQVIEQVWERLVLPMYSLGKHVRVADAHNRPHMDQCIFGTLALLYHGHELVHFDRWVWKHLPPEHDLHHFQMAQVKQKAAKIVISRFYDLSREAGMLVTIDVTTPVAAIAAMGVAVKARGVYCKRCEKRFLDGVHVCESANPADSYEH